MGLPYFGHEVLELDSLQKWLDMNPLNDAHVQDQMGLSKTKMRKLRKEDVFTSSLF